MAEFEVGARVHCSGPLFDGTAFAVLNRIVEETVLDLAQSGQSRIRNRALHMDKSGRGGTGRAAAGVELRGDSQEASSGIRQRVIHGGIRRGEYSWPWLEGTSERNQTTRFRGYHTFARTARQLDQEAEAVAARVVARHLPELGGA